jgi:hypothetical protein
MPETLKKTRPKSKTGKFPNNIELDQIAINVKSHKLLDQLLKENPKLEELMRNAKNDLL